MSYTACLLQTDMFLPRPSLRLQVDYYDEDHVVPTSALVG